MGAFALVFDLVMTAWPAAFVLAFPARPRPTGAGAVQLRRQLALLIAVTAAAAAVVVVGHFLIERPVGLWALCFPLWWLLAMPTLRLKRPDWFTPGPAPAQRVASLRSRMQASPLSPWAWSAPWAVWVAAAAVVISLTRSSAWPEPLLPWLMGAMGGLWLLLGQYGTRWFLLEPEPLDGGGSPELLEAYARLRRFKVFGWFALACAAMLVFTGVALLAAVRAELTTMVVLGAGGGSLLGVAGGALGTYGTVLRGRIVELRRHLEAAG